MDPYIGEIRLFAGNFPPYGWSFCEGQILSIAENDTLFALIGTTYGGDGQITFALPDLRGRIALHQGTDSASNSYALGERGGAEQVSLTTQQIAAHGHTLTGTMSAGGAAPATNAATTTPVGNLPARGGATNYSQLTPTAALSSVTLMPTGGGQPHDNLMPYICVNYIISLYGIYPSST
jgi:microcystin-dependent protein